MLMLTYLAHITWCCDSFGRVHLVVVVIVVDCIFVLVLNALVCVLPRLAYSFLRYAVSETRSRSSQAALRRIVSTACETVRSQPGILTFAKNSSTSRARSSEAKFSIKYLMRRVSRNPP